MRLRLLAILLLCTAIATALDPKTLQYQGYVNDFAGVLDAASRADLERYCTRVEQATGAQMAFVTVKTLDGEPIEQFANDLFHQWGVGNKQQDTGLMLLLATADRTSRRKWALASNRSLRTGPPERCCGRCVRLCGRTTTDRRSGRPRTVWGSV